MSRWESPSGSWEDHEDDFAHARTLHEEHSGSEEDTSSHSTNDSFSESSPLAPSFALVRSETTLPEVISFQKPWLQKRHLTNGNPSPIQARHNRFHQWRLQDKLKTGNGAIVVCLNLDVDPPDVVKTQPCAVLEGWIDPRKLGSAKALEAIGKNLCQQFQSLNTRIKYKPFLDPSIDEARRFCVNLRKTAKDERLCFYYNGHGVPKPTSSGELWVFNKTYSQYIPVSLYDLQTWLGSPVVYVWDCSAAGNLVKNFIKYAKKRDEEAMARHGGNIDGSPPHSQAIQLAACLANETLPMAPSMPADMFTSCLTSPIEMALQFYYLHQNPPAGVTIEMLHEVPGDLKDRRTPLGELNWIFTAVTDTIAWTSFSRPIFKRLFRQDLLVAALFRNFLLAERVMRNYHCTPHTIPPLPSTATHPLWAAWDRSLEDIIKQLPDLLKAAKPPKTEPLQIMEGIPFVPTPYKYEYKSSSFFTDHLTAFEHWMSRGGGALTKVGPWSMPPLEDLDDDVPAPDDEPPKPDLVPRRPPAQLPILLQVLLSQAHRMRALTLLCQFVDLGPWAVHLVLEIGIYPYVQKLLLSPQPDLKPLLIFIWSRLIAFDKTCQVDLLREQQFTYFATILDYSTPIGIAQTFEHRAMCAFILASLCRDHSQGQAACLAWNNGTLLDFYLYHITNSDDFLLKQWCCLAIGQLWDGRDDAKELGLEQNVPRQLLFLVREDVSSEARAAALYALSIFYGASGSASADVKGAGGTGRMSSLSEKAHLKVELESAVEALRATKTDASPIVRKEAVVLISALVNEWRGYFTVAAWLYWEGERQRTNKPPGQSPQEDVASRARDEWMSSIRCTDPEMKRQHRKILNKVFLVLTYLYDLVVDPHIEVATMATTVLDFVVAMLLESPFSRIRGTTVRGPPAPPMSNSARVRKASSSGSTSGNVSRQPSTTNITPSALSSALQPLQRADSPAHPPTRSSFPSLMRTSSFASAFGSLAGLAMGTQSTENSAPPSPSQSQTSDIEFPPAPALNLAQYSSPYQQSPSPEPSAGPMIPVSPRPLSFHSASSVTNGHGHVPQSAANLTSRFSPATVMTALITHDLIQFYKRRRSQENGSPNARQYLWEDFDIDRSTLEELEEMGLDVGSGLNQTLPLKSKLYDWCLEYYKEPQMRQLDEDEPGSRQYTRQVWRRNRDSEALELSAIRGRKAPQRSWSHPHGSWRLPFAPTRMTFHQFDPHVAFSDDGAHVSLYDWRRGAQISGFNNGNPKGTGVTSLHFVDEEVGGALVVGSSDGVVRVYNNYDPCYSEGNSVQLVSGFRALATMVPATHGAGIVTEWNQMWNRLLCGGDSESVYDWDAMTERCVTVIATEENCPLTSMTSNPYSRRTFVAGFGNGAIKVYDTRASSSSNTCLQNRREHRSWVANVKYQTGASKQVLSASVDGTVNLWDLRNLEGVVSSWDVFADGLASFDVHPASDVFVASSSLSRSWRNQAVVLHPLPRPDKLPRPHHPYPSTSNSDNTAHEQLKPITSDTFPTGLTSPSRAHGHATNLHFAPSVLGFHPTEMMYALGTADGLVRLAGCQFLSGKQGADEEPGEDAVSDHMQNLQAAHGANGALTGKAEQPVSKPRISFPSMRLAPRRNEGEERNSEGTAEKRMKQDNTSAAILVENMKETMKTVNKRLPAEYNIGPVISKIPQALLNPETSAETVSAQVELFKEFCQSRLEAVSIKLEGKQGKTLSKKLEWGNFVEAKAGLDSIISDADGTHTLLPIDDLIIRSFPPELHSALLSKPPPSAYADASIWRDVQTHPRPILCLRPTDKHGLPFVLLHQVFSQFQQLSRGRLPNSLAGVNALRVALRLCSRMGDSFEDEKARGMAFDEAMGGFLQGVDGARRLEGNQTSGEADRVYRINGHCMIIREDKVEMGKAGDAYTQVARWYDLACERMEANGVTPNAPVFLLCVMGPSLTIAGGFKDGNDTVVEPLSPILLMLKDLDNVNGRAIQLATHLLALHTCLEQLPFLPNPASPVPGMPRVFASFRDVQDTEHTLTFRRRLSTDLLLFNAVDEISRGLCVKIVYGSYGEEVHCTLGREEMAPKLLGVSRIDGGPTMVVMEMFDEPWQTLYSFAQRNSRWTDDRVKTAIHKRLEEVLEKLEGGGLVHGDFRANNIMVKPGEEESAVVVDFDWAGKDGEVRYPLYRNDEGVEWPSEPGSAIRLDHDWSMLETQWKSLLSPQFR